jgi:hypothetical protein
VRRLVAATATECAGSGTYWFIANARANLADQAAKIMTIRHKRWPRVQLTSRQAVARGLETSRE